MCLLWRPPSSPLLLLLCTSPSPVTASPCVWPSGRTRSSNASSSIPGPFPGRWVPHLWHVFMYWPGKLYKSGYIIWMKCHVQNVSFYRGPPSLLLPALTWQLIKVQKKSCITGRCCCVFSFLFFFNHCGAGLSERHTAGFSLNCHGTLAMHVAFVVSQSSYTGMG